MNNFNKKAGDVLSGIAGSMNTLWGVAIFQAIWMIGMTLMSGPDKYPFAFLLFMGNIVQLLFLFVIQNSQNRQMDHLMALVSHINADEDRELESLGKHSEPITA